MITPLWPSRRDGALLAAAVAVVAVLSQVRCEPSSPSADLLASVVAAAPPATSHLDLGEAADVTAIASGLSGRLANEGTSYRWLRATGAEVRLAGFPGRPGILRARLQVPHELSVEAFLNGQALGSRPAPRGWNTIEWPVAAGLMQPRNIVGLRAPAAPRVAELMEQYRFADHLAVAVDAVELVATPAPSPPVRRYASALDQLETGAGAAICLRAANSGLAPTHGEGSKGLAGRLELGWRAADAGPAPILRVRILDDGGGEKVLRLRPRPGARSGSATLRLRAQTGMVALVFEPAPTTSAPGAWGPTARLTRLRGAGFAVVSTPQQVQSPLLTSAERPQESLAGRLRGFNVIFYLVDTLRADATLRSTRPATRAETPELDRFAANSIRFSRARSQASWTKPATASILTGHAPTSHSATRENDSLPAGVQTLAEVLRDSGYDTAAYMTQPNISYRKFGFAQGFERFEGWARYARKREPDRLREARPSLFAGSDAVVKAAAEWMTQARRPFFLYVHTVEPHAPYDADPAWLRPYQSRPYAPVRGSIAELVRFGMPGAASPEVVRQLHDLYRAEVGLCDANFGKLIAAMHAAGLDERTLVVFVSDHGEEFYEHGGLRHGHSLYDELLGVPLLLSAPAALAARTVEAEVTTADLYPTVLSLLGLAARPTLTARDWTDPNPQPRASWAEVEYGDSFLWSVRRDGLKLIHDPMTGATSLFDVGRDPGEQRNLATIRRATVVRLRCEAYGVWSALLAERATPAAAVKLPPDLQRELRALGYLK